MVTRFAYPVELTADVEGGFIVRVPDLPEIVTQGDDRREALAAAGDAIDEALAGRIHLGENIPEPSPAKGRPLVAASGIMTAKAALSTALHEAGVSQVELARRLEVDDKEARRLLDPRHPSKLPRLEQALAALGKRLDVRVVDRVA